jgi:raffinose/stachyose/melibiose transport system permease protein
MTRLLSTRPNGIPTWRRAALYVALLAFAIPLFFLPLWIVIVTSFKPLGEAIELSPGLPETWTAIENYAQVFSVADYPRGLFNSVVVTGASIALTLIVGSLGAWAFGRSRSRLMLLLYFVAITGVLLPPAVVPTMFLMRGLGMAGTHEALILFLVGTRLGFVIFLITGFVRSLPAEIEESAYVDGAGHLRAFWHIVLPLLSPILITAGIILLVTNWNDFFGAFFLLQGEDRATLPLSLYRLPTTSVHQTPWHLVFAHLVLVSLPLIVVYAFAQRRLVEGLTSGSLRG